MPIGPRTDIPFARDDAHQFLPWLIGIMVALATLLLCLSLTLGSWVIDRHGTYDHSFTASLPASADNDAQRKVQAALEQTAGVTAVKRLSDSELAHMLSGWLSGGEIGNLPLPTMFDVTFDKKATIDYRALQKTLSDIAPGAQVDAHEAWMKVFSDFSAALRTLLTLLAVIIIASIGMMVAFTSRASLKLHMRTVHLLHSIGAEDHYIARQFQHEAFALVLPGAAAGCVSAGFIYWACGVYIASLGASIMPALNLQLAHIGLLLAIPIACSLVAWTVARISVMRQLALVL